MTTKRTDKGMTQLARLADPTNEQRGFIRVNVSKRGLLVKNDTTTAPFFRGATAKSCKALTPCIATRADGTQYLVVKTRKRRAKVVKVEPTVKVKIRQLILRGPITDYLDVADRVGLNAQNVANEYRYRRDNGYQVEVDVPIESNATFRGA